MLVIHKGDKERVIPAGAYEMYASAGWSLDKEIEKDISKSVSEPLLEESEEPVEEEIEYVDPEELATRPLNELDKDELRILAEFKGIDVSVHRSSKQLREMIRSLE